MSDQPTAAVTAGETFLEWFTADERPGYAGYIVPAERMHEAAEYLKTRKHFDMLTSVTAADYFPEDRIEMIYHFRRSTGGEPLRVKSFLSRENSQIDSLVDLYPGAELQEREVWDLMGVRFTNHPDLRRILTWEGFAGHPLRKDWKEPFYEEEVKPFKSRWPEGKFVRAEEKNPLGDNTRFPAGFDPDTWVPDNDDILYKSMTHVAKAGEDGFDSDTIIVNLGPQHPSTHGVFRMVARLDGETVVDLKPVMGYLHRNHEKIGERNTFLGNMPFTDRLDYICAMSNNFAYALAVEKLLNVAPPERAEYIRVIMAELTRIVNHLVANGFLLNDLGAFFTPVLYSLEEREFILDFFEAVSGSRMMCNYFRFGGVVRDIDENAMKMLKAILERLPRKMDELEKYLTGSEIVRVRAEGVGVLTPEAAIANSASGPLLRATGVPYDLRRADPYSIYDRFDFDICVRYHGDIYDRFMLRLDEIRQSIRILKQAVKDIPAGPVITGKPQYQVRVPAGESYGRVEGPKGELGFYLVSTGKTNPARYHVRAPTFINLTSLAGMSRGNKVADVVTILGSIDIVLGEVDR
jgi:NADH-quinone oxidoreductase subunit D/NADH-quinone oxidoreductase subunit C/D